MFGRYQPDNVEHSKNSLYKSEIKGNLEYIMELIFLMACSEASRHVGVNSPELCYSFRGGCI